MSAQLNNARIKCFGSGVPVYNWTCVDNDRSIWKGTRIIEPGTPSDAFETVYFSRLYDLDNSDLDRMIHEYEFIDTDILGVPFLVVPKEKLIFGYDAPSSLIAKPPVKTAAPSPFNR